MASSIRVETGPNRLNLATDLLHRVRLSDTDAGIWEAADLQWWWRTPRTTDRLQQAFWLDDEGPVATVAMTDWGRTLGCDPIVFAGQTTTTLATIWPSALDVLASLRPQNVEVLVRDDDAALKSLVSAASFKPTGERTTITWMPAANRVPVVAPPRGFSLFDRTLRSDRPHHMIRRSGPQVESRLAECSLYDPELDLCVEADDGQVAGYGLFWFDPVTKVGLVEPMRTEDAYQRRGVAKAVLTAGLDRLARRGATRLKVSYEAEIPGRLYTGAGFRPGATCETYRLIAEPDR